MYLKFTVGVIIALLYTGCVHSIPKSYKPVSKNSKIYKKEDKFSGTTYFIHKELYGHSPYEIRLANIQGTMLKLKYYGSDWIFFNTAIFLNDTGDKIVFDGIKSYDKKTEVRSGGKVEEWIYIPLNEQQVLKLKNIFSQNNISVRLSGKYYKNYKINSKEILATREMLNFKYVSKNISSLCLKSYYEAKNILKVTSKNLNCSTVYKTYEIFSKYKSQCTDKEISLLGKKPEIGLNISTKYLNKNCPNIKVNE